jgi:acetolactate decarboxylase
VLKRPGILLFAAFLVLTASFCSYAQQVKTLTQTSTIDALAAGVYDGKMSLRQLKMYGDTGLGTFDALDGEMMLVDGTVYQVRADGTVHVPGPDETTPFAAVTFFEPDREKTLTSGINLKQLTDEIDSILPTLNVIYALRIEGSFKKVRTRSVPRQSKPYRPLAEVVKTQPTFNFENVEGVIVGLRCPPFMKAVNVSGYHLHFLTKDKKAGGHVLGLTVDKAVVKIDQINNFYVILPENQDFYRLNMETDRSAAVSAVETRN